jgi:hypothetical protein
MTPIDVKIIIGLLFFILACLNKHNKFVFKLSLIAAMLNFGYGIVFEIVNFVKYWIK